MPDTIPKTKYILFKLKGFTYDTQLDLHMSYLYIILTA